MGTQHQDVIEINGKKYNAITGQLIKVTNASQPTAQTKQPLKHSGVALDGFVRHAGTKPANHSKHAQKSQTLMRSSVKKPSALVPAKLPAPVHNSSVVHPKIGPSPERLKAAKEIIKHPHISHFGDIRTRSSVVKKIQQAVVKQPSIAHHVVQPPSPLTETHEARHIKPRSHAASVLIEKALASATAHEQPQHPMPAKATKRRKLAGKLGISARAMAISSSVVAGVLLGGFFAVQNVPNLSMRVAAARAGFNASMPGYSPSGFSFRGPINYSPGQVTISFRSNADDRAYAVTQRASNWNSDALLSNFVVVSNKQYQTYLDRGRTLYIYDGSSATWIDNGVWYQVEGNSDMTTDQLVRIAASI